MEAEVHSKLVLSFEHEEIKALIEIINILALKPHSVGFGKKDFTEDQRDFIQQLYSLFDEQSSSDT